MPRPLTHSQLATAGEPATPCTRMVWRMAVLALLLCFRPPMAHANGSWSGDFVLTIRGSGSDELAVPRLPGGKARATWDVNRTVRGRMVLDRMFKGSGIAGTADGRNLDRFETWIAARPQVIDMEVDDHGTYFGIVSSGHPAQDKTVFKCPVPDERRPTGQLRSSILQFDKRQGSWTLEIGRMIHRCATSTLRTPQFGPPSWSSRPPFEQRPNAHELEFEIWHGLYPLDEYHQMTGPYRDGDTELVLTRDFTFHWARGLSAKAPVPARFELVLRKSP